MSVSTIRRALRSLPEPYQIHPLDVNTLLPLLRIAIALFLLPWDNAVLLASYIAGSFFPILSRTSTSPSPTSQRKAALRNVHFYPKTVLITGLDTPHGLALARTWFSYGHRVVGADLLATATARAIPPSGGSMSNAVAAFYRIPQAQYVARLLDVVHREKVDIWIPCSDAATGAEDAVAKEVVESRTHCRCVTLDSELTTRFGRPDSLVKFLVEKDLPVVENHQVQSRDSIHKILHRSPSKVYHLRQSSPAVGGGGEDARVVFLPKRTLSLTYSEISEVQISKESPWVLQQQTRLGEFFADLLVVRGQLRAIKIRCEEEDSRSWGTSRLDQGLAAAIHRLMERFASKGGARLTGHLCVRVLVDEEFAANYVQYAVHIAGCVQGADAVQCLLKDKDAAAALVSGYLSVLSNSNVNSSSLCVDSVHAPRAQAASAASISSGQRRLSLYRWLRRYDARNNNVLTTLYPVAERVDRVVRKAREALVVWENWRFAVVDPLPWWWHAHVSRPWEDVEMVLSRRSRSSSKKA